jgi:4-carboxymuconolactone decarboxylase
MVAVSALAALQKTEELKVHLHGALNVGVPVRKLAETIFQIGVYAGSLRSMRLWQHAKRC